MTRICDTQGGRLVSELAGVRQRSLMDPSLDKTDLTVDVVRRMKDESTRAAIFVDDDHSKMAAAFAYDDRSGIALKMTVHFANGSAVADYADAFDYTRRLTDRYGMRPIEFSDWRGF